jgi:hypothetical protein
MGLADRRRRTAGDLLRLCRVDAECERRDDDAAARAQLTVLMCPSPVGFECLCPPGTAPIGALQSRL